MRCRAKMDSPKWFNLLYLMVTKQVNAPPAGWKAPAWIEQLDVVFAHLYLNGLTGSIQTPATVPQFLASALRGALYNRY